MASNEELHAASSEALHACANSFQLRKIRRETTRFC